MALEVLEVGAVYEYDYLHKLIGHGSHGHYLLHQGETVYGAFLRETLNPAAPNIILVGDTPIIRRAGEALLKQQLPIPVFLKKGSDKWRYEGEFRSIQRLSLSATEGLAKSCDRNDVAFAILLECLEMIEGNKTYIEGACNQVTTTRYERNLQARAACLAHWGFRCSVCQILFEEEYGSRGKDFIHVHHLNPLHQSDGNMQTDPTVDLCPVCPNCHAMIHAKRDLWTLEELRNEYWSPASRQAREKRGLIQAI